MEDLIALIDRKEALREFYQRARLHEQNLPPVRVMLGAVQDMLRTYDTDLTIEARSALLQCQQDLECNCSLEWVATEVQAYAEQDEL